VSLLLARIDDRLIHGQVILGCCAQLRARRLLLCNDDVAGDALQRRIYAAAVPPEVDLEILDRTTALQRLRELLRSGGDAATILLVQSPGDLLWLLRAGVDLRAVNLGGLHFRAGAQEVWPGVFLTAQERADLLDLLRRGVRVTLQTLPTAAAHEATVAELAGPGERP
jgi:mannose/fructose/N-acetylgalactosamine-specific phosphotransferase system component IIB